MATFLLDSSAVVKRYITETGSTAVLDLTDPRAGHDLHLAEITIVEVISAIARRQRAGDIANTQAQTAIGEFRHDCQNQYGLISISSSVIAQATNLAERHFLRGYDAVQLAATLELQGRLRAARHQITLVSADAALNTAAQQEGLPVMNPQTS